MMEAIITICPFQDPEHLSSTADKGMEPLKAVIEERLENIRDIGLPIIAGELDDAYLAAINAAQNETIRNTICIYCDQNMICHPPVQTA